jgi:hypothetical protein
LDVLLSRNLFLQDFNLRLNLPAELAHPLFILLYSCTYIQI